MAEKSERSTRVAIAAVYIGCAIVVISSALMLTGCASMAAPDVKTDNVKDGTVVCATIMGPWGTGKTVVAKLEERVIRDGGSVRVDPNCVIDIQLSPPLPKPATVKPEPAAK